MKTIHKKVIEVVDGAQTVIINSGSRLIHVHEQGGKITAWFKVDTEREPSERMFKVVGTGHDITDDWRYVATIHIGDLVWHLHEWRYHSGTTFMLGEPS
jgi:hypothetical protein